MKYLDLDSIIHPLVFELDFLKTNILNGLELYCNEVSVKL